MAAYWPKSTEIGPMGVSTISSFSFIFFSSFFIFSHPNGPRTLSDIIQAICLHANVSRYEKRFVFCDASSFLAVTGHSLSLISVICLIHSSDIFPNKIIGYAIVAAAVNNAAVFIHRNKISPPCFFHSNLKRDSGSCPSVSQCKSLQRVICVFEVRNN